MPVSKEELEHLLREHREQKQQLLEMQAKNTLSHAEKIKQKLEARLNRKSPQNQDDISEVSGDDADKVKLYITCF